MAPLLDALRFALHYGGHALLPGLVAWALFRPRWRRAWALMLATWLVDLDHLLADPVFDPERCSVGFHPLHSGWAIGAYVALLAVPRARLLAAGLLLHMVVDGQDCLWMG
ncbi:MAG: DUF6122 family protein [Myxococcota bacterium]